MKNASNSQVNPFSSTLNFIIAVSAMFVSVASFYATYLQANAADQQVKAMTYPLIQFSSGNYNRELKTSVIQLNLVNSGVGPAIIKHVGFNYLGKQYKNAYAFLKACCEDEYKSFQASEENNTSQLEYQIITSPTSNVILPINDKITMLSLERFEVNKGLWDSLDKARFELIVSACYCSLLDICYETEEVGVVVEVESCS